MEDSRSYLFRREGSLKWFLAIILGILLNVLCAKLIGLSGLPFYLDSIGTIAVSALGGFLPGIITSVATNVINGYFDYLSVYYSLLNGLIALATVWFFRYRDMKKTGNVVLLILCLAFIGGGIGSLFTYMLSGVSDSGTALTMMKWMEGTLGMGAFPAHVVSAFLLDVVDKAFSVAIALLIVRAVPQKVKDEIAMFGWRQAPLSREDRERLNNRTFHGKHSMLKRVVWMLVVSTLMIGLAVTWVSTKTFSEYSQKEHIRVAEGTANLAASEIDPDKVDQYLEMGEKAPGYKAVEDKLYTIRDSCPDIEYVYVYRIEEDGCHVVFDLDTEELQGDEPGALIEFDKDFETYLPALLAGKPIDPIVSKGQYGWLLTVYHPLYDSKGKCVCYVAADISMMDLREYDNSFLIRIILVFSGFFLLILGFTMWILINYMVLPINSMEECANAFAFSSDDDDTLKDKVRRIRDLQIRTGDEVENLYHAFCKVTEDSVQHMEDIEEQARTIDEMQKGLIMTMADMVEGRDSDTGDHVRKTAAYADIILRGLRKKGYYTDQLTDKFMSDVVQSAPLHDIGKINVSDTILNKPGKLTDEEFEIMKTHTTAGCEILDKTISTVHGESYLMEGRNLAAYHHEKWNGRGYPTGLKEEEIPLSARIMAVADVFDALASKRVYKDAMPFEKAIAIIREDAGSHFDPKVVEAFMDNLDEVKAVLDYYNSREDQPEEST